MPQSDADCSVLLVQCTVAYPKGQRTGDRRILLSRDLATAKLSDNRNCLASASELSMGWVDPWVGLGRVGLDRDFSVFERIMLMHLKHG